MREGSSLESSCCSGLFDASEFTRFQDADPPKRKGVCVIRTCQRGTAVREVHEKAVDLAKSIGRGAAEKFLHSRLDRFVDVGDCPTIYIGSAGTYAGSKNTLHGRYRELATRHTAKYPVWALLAPGWELQYGWMVVDDHPGVAEEALKVRVPKSARREAAGAGEPVGGVRLVQDSGTLPTEPLPNQKRHPYLPVSLQQWTSPINLEILSDYDNFVPVPPGYSRLISMKEGV